MTRRISWQSVLTTGPVLNTKDSDDLGIRTITMASRIHQVEQHRPMVPGIEAMTLVSPSFSTSFERPVRYRSYSFWRAALMERSCNCPCLCGAT
jgi:hypothetical protein